MPENHEPEEACPKHPRKKMWEWNGRRWICTLCVQDKLEEDLRSK